MRVFHNRVILRRDRCILLINVNAVLNLVCSVFFVCIELRCFGVVALFAVASSHLLGGQTRRVANPARQEGTAEQESLTPPVGLKPVEQAAWLAMARRQRASDGTVQAGFHRQHGHRTFGIQRRFPLRQGVSCWGLGDIWFLTSAELYDPATGRGRRLAAWPRNGPSYCDAAALRQGAGGGRRKDDGALTSAELYDPASGTWTLPAVRHRT